MLRRRGSRETDPSWTHQLYIAQASRHTETARSQFHGRRDHATPKPSLTGTRKKPPTDRPPGDRTWPLHLNSAATIESLGSPEAQLNSPLPALYRRTKHTADGVQAATNLTIRCIMHPRQYQAALHPPRRAWTTTTDHLSMAKHGQDTVRPRSHVWPGGS